MCGAPETTLGGGREKITTEQNRKSICKIRGIYLEAAV